MKRVLGSTVVALLATGCEQDVSKPNYEYMPDMVSSVAYDSFAPRTPTVA